jgi:hypothetical protein
MEAVDHEQVHLAVVGGAGGVEERGEGRGEAVEGLVEQVQLPGWDVTGGLGAVGEASRRGNGRATKSMSPGATGRSRLMLRGVETKETRWPRVARRSAISR